MEREFMEFDVVIVGAGPAGLSAACRLKQKAAEAGQEISVCVVEKGSEVGAHILSGAVFEPRALNELFPDWKELGAPLNTPVKGDDIYVLTSADAGTKVPGAFVPKTMHNEGNYIISLGNLCRWLAGVEQLPRMSRVSQLTVSAPRLANEACTLDCQLNLLFGLVQKVATSETVTP